MTKNTAKDFDAISRALEKGDTEELDRLMAVADEAPENDEEDKEPEVPEVEDTDSTEEKVPEEDDANESEDSPTEVDDGDSTKDGEDPTEAAVTAASTVTNTEREKELERELQRVKSDAGRVPFIQRRMAELERELRAYKAREAQPTPGTGGTNAASVELDPETQREIDELREVDPVMAKTLERVAKAALAAASSRVDQVVTTFTQADQEAEDYRFLSEQKAELLREIPQADQIFATPEWSRWKDTLTPGQRAMAESAYATDVKQAIYAFAAAMQAAQGRPAQPAPAVQQPDPAAEKVKQARNQKVAKSADVSAATARRTVELDEAAFFEEAYNKVGKDNHILPK